MSAGRLESELGIDHDLAVGAADADVDTLLDLASAAPSWQGQALLDLATGTPFEEVRDAYFTGAGGGSDIGTPSSTDDLVRSMDSGASRASFHLIEDDEALEKILASGNFANWRIFLHPEQQKYVDINAKGPYRLTGGAGTGKTVVLVHRAVRLARKAQQEGKDPRIVLTTYTRNLADSLESQIRALDNTIERTTTLGRSGVYIDNVDRIARNLVIGRADAAVPMETVLGWGPRCRCTRRTDRESVGPFDRVVECSDLGLERVGQIAGVGGQGRSAGLFFLVGPFGPVPGTAR